jgi:hypothetical protein
MRRLQIPVPESSLRIPECFLGAAAAARVLGMSVRRFYRLVASGLLLPDGYLQGEMRFRYSRLESFIVDGLPGKYGRRFTVSNGPNIHPPSSGSAR